MSKKDEYIKECARQLVLYREMEKKNVQLSVLYENRYEDMKEENRILKAQLRTAIDASRELRTLVSGYLHTYRAWL